MKKNQLYPNILLEVFVSVDIVGISDLGKFRHAAIVGILELVEV